MRIDRLLCCLRFVKTRSQAHALVDQGHIRCNSRRVTRASHAVSVGDVLTLPIGDRIEIAEITCLPTRRGPPAEAQACYHLLDPHG